jgi:hypothetical protein
MDLLEAVDGDAAFDQEAVDLSHHATVGAGGQRDPKTVGPDGYTGPPWGPAQ